MTRLYRRALADVALVSRARARARRSGWLRHHSSQLALGSAIAQSGNFSLHRRTGEGKGRPSEAVTRLFSKSAEAPSPGDTESAKGAVVLPFSTEPRLIHDRTAANLAEPRMGDSRHAASALDVPAARMRGACWWAARAALGILGVGAATATLLPPLAAYAGGSRVESAIAPRVAARTALFVHDRNGAPMGVLPQDGNPRTIAALPSSSGNPDFARALRALESQHTYFGVAPHRIVWAGLCFVAAAPVGRQENCPGASTLLMQAGTTIRGGKAGRNPALRKLEEFRDAAALSVRLPPGFVNEDHFIADNLLFGYAGRPIIGIEAASLILFGKSAKEISLAEASILAATPKRQLAFYCGNPSAETVARAKARWREIRVRADYALTRAFSKDPRLASARAEVRSMPSRIRPAPLPDSLTRGMTGPESCLAAADPVHRAELVDSGLREVVASELQELPRPNGRPISAVSLATAADGQIDFKASISRSLRSLQAARGSGWLRPLLIHADRADVLGMTMDRDGAITGLYASHARGIQSEPRRLGSVSKLAALLAFAAAGRGPDSILCNRAAQGLRNANGDMGYPDCSHPRARVPLRTAFAQSLNLPILEELRNIDPAIVARAARDAGFRGDSANLPYQIAFGVAEAEPRRTAATAAAMARGAAGLPAVAPLPHGIVRYRVDGHWYPAPRRWVDLRAYFPTERARRLVAAAGAAPLRQPDGTLRAAVAPGGIDSSELAKSGTDAREDLLTYAKTAVGATADGSWFVLVAADRGPVGDRHVAITPLIRVVRGRTFHLGR